MSQAPEGQRFFSEQLTVSVLPIASGGVCCVLDDVLSDPDALVDWACEQPFGAPLGYPYPGVVLPVPESISLRVAELFAQHARSRLGGRRTHDAKVRLSMVTTPPEELQPCQWLCHRDRVADDPAAGLFAASVLYLFRDPSLGGTSFYRPRRPAADIDRLVADSMRLDAQEFERRHGVHAGYMSGSNAYFECVAQVPARWNRMIIYDGAVFHSADIGATDRLSSDPRRGRLTLNGFFTCSRAAQ